MSLKYHYSTFANILFFIFGIFLLFFGLDQLFFNTEIVSDLLKNFNKTGENIELGLWIMVFLGTLLTSGFLINLIRGKNYVLEANKNGIIIYTGSTKESTSKIKVDWSDFIKIETRHNLGVFRWHDGNRGWTKVLVIKTVKDSIDWPSIMFTKNKISFKSEDNYDEIIINAWLNKNKTSITNEINKLALNYKKNYPDT